MARAQVLTQHQSQIRFRARHALLAFAALYGLLLGRLGYLQLAEHAYFQAQGDAIRRDKAILPARRGMILDRNGDPLAINIPAVQVYADPSTFHDPMTVHTAAVTLSPLLPGRSVDWIEHALTRNPRSHFVSLLRHAPKELGPQVTALGLTGIYVDDDTRRSYPNDTLAAQVLGFTNGDLKGAEGVERSQDAQLEGKDGLMIGDRDQQGRFLPGTIKRSIEPVNGDDLTLTIDKNLQSAADLDLAAAVKQHHAARGVVVVMDPSTGEILALSNAPGYDPNAPRPMHGATVDQVKAAVSSWRDGAVSDLYEPGSTLKTITASAVLQDEGLDAEYRHVYCSGELQVGKHIIHCAKDPPKFGVHGDEDLRGILRDSCNVGMAQFGMALGADKLYDFEQKFGFLDYPGSGLPGEAKSHLQAPTSFNKYTQRVGWSDIQLANVSFGQGVSVTPLQLATAYCAIANGGILYRPHIVRAVTQGDKTQVIAPQAIRRVLSPEVAAEVRSMLGTVVKDGTGKPAQIAGFSVGGKTGSAQVAGRHGYEEGHYVASFIGMVPLSNPKLVILCAVFEPQGVHWGAAVAAPVVHDIEKRATLEMHLLPDDPTAVDWDDRNRSTRHMQAEVTTVDKLLQDDEGKPSTDQ